MINFEAKKGVAERGRDMVEKMSGGGKKIFACSADKWAFREEC